MKLQQFAPKKYRRRIFSQLWMLALQFILGIILVFTDSRSGGWHTLYIVVLIIHILNGIGLVEGNIYIALKAPSRLAWWAAAVISLTALAGLFTLLTGSDWWSFAMAVGFIVAACQHVVLYVRADRQVVAAP